YPRWNTDHPALAATPAPELLFFGVWFSELGLQLHAFAFGVLELFTKLAVFLGKPLGTLTPHVAAGGAIENLDAGGFEFGLTAIGLRFPTIAAFEQLGNQDAQGGTEGLPDVGHGHGVAVHGG